MKKTEAKIQQEIFTYHYNKYPEQRGWLFMVYNNPRNKVSGARLKSQGMIAGAPDLMFLRPFDTPICIEIKTPTGRQSGLQKQFQRMVQKDLLAEYYIIRSLEEAKKAFGWTR